MLERVLAAAFGQRRKMLRVSLKAPVPIGRRTLLEAANLPPTARAEQIDVVGFCRLASRLCVPRGQQRRRIQRLRAELADEISQTRLAFAASQPFGRQDRPGFRATLCSRSLLMMT